jgi:hypothetical protein
MQLVLFGLYCRLRHLHALVEEKYAETCRRVLYSGCADDQALVRRENGFLDDGETCDLPLAKQIVAFWQGGGCGLHTPQQIRDNLNRVMDGEKQPYLFKWIREAFNNGRFQIDESWIQKRSYVASYRKKGCRLPAWVLEQVSRFADSYHVRRLLEIGHVEAVDWVIPMDADENLERYGMRFPDDSILTDQIRNVWTRPEVNAVVQSQIPSVSPLNPVASHLDASHIGDQDMMHLSDSVIAIFEPTNQARSVERVGIDAAALEDDFEIVEETQTMAQVLFLNLIYHFVPVVITRVMFLGCER